MAKLTPPKKLPVQSRPKAAKLPAQTPQMYQGMSRACDPSRMQSLSDMRN
jgi:hypothetical protein